MKHFLSFIAFFVLLLAGTRLQAQVYPVNGNSVLIPPYSVYLADYTEGTSDRLVMNLVLNDVSRPELRVRLQLKIISQNITLETKPEYIGSEIILEGGVPLRLTGLDLAEYFNPNNLNFSGISRREFEKTGALPANFYQFCFEVLEYNRGVKISNSICANGWLILNDPPIINLPRNGEKLAPTQPQNIVFQWTPRHTGSPNSAFTTEYDVKLVELWPATRNPNDAILTSPPILEETTRSTTFIYDISQTPLELGRHYALQIKAKSIVGADELDLFKNNGKSEVITFVYGDPCSVPKNILAEATSATRFKVNWTGDFNHTVYSLRYRLADNPSAQWYTSTTLVPDAGISALQPNATYEFQVAGGCGVFESAFSPVARIKTFDTSEQGYSCGMPLEQFNLDPANLLEALKVGDIIQAGDFDVRIAKISGSNGTFTGEGVIEVPFFNKASVKAEFANIVVNKEMRMVNGYLNVTGAGVDILPSQEFMDQLSETLAGLDSTLANLEANLPEPFDPDAFVPDVTLNLPGPVIINTEPDGTVVVTDANGQNHTLPPGTEAAIVDDKGNATFIDSNGKEHSVTAAQAAAAINREYNLMLKFTKVLNNPNQYGFDSYEANEPTVLQNRYDKLDEDYFIPYKSVEAGRTDVVSANLEDSGIDKTKIRFEMGGVPVPSTPFSGNESTVTVSSKCDGEEEALIAIFSPEDDTQKDQVLGRANLVTYNRINRNVVIIPVNDNAFTETERTFLQTELNRIYNQAVVSWSVVLKPGITVPGISPFDVGSSGLLSNYTDHMKQVINAYKDNMNDGEDTYYLFLVNNPSDPDKNGFMPRSKQAGFIFKDRAGSGPEFARTVAHELGHGAFNLHHTFMEENFSIPRGETDNLMDYTGGVQLYKYQWDMMRYPPIVMGLFEGDDEGQSRTGASDEEEIARIIEEVRCGCLKQKDVKFLANTGDGLESFQVNDFKLLNGQIIKDLNVITRRRSAPLSSDYITFDPKQQVSITESTQLGHAWTMAFQERGPGIVRFTSDNKEDLELLLKYFNSSQADFDVQMNRRIDEFESEISKATPDLEKLKTIVFSIRCGFEKLKSAESRFFILKGIANEYWIDALDETVIIEILRTTLDKQQADELIAKLDSDNTGILEEFDGELPGTGINDAEYDAYYQELTKLFYRANSGQVSKLFDDFSSNINNYSSNLLDNDLSIIEHLAKRRILIWSNPGLVKFIGETDFSYVDYEDLNIESSKLSFSVDHVRWFGADYDFTIKNYSPFEPIAVFFITNSSDLFTPATDRTSTLRGEFLIMPAVGLYSLNKLENQTTFNRTVEAISFVIPAGLGIKASRWGWVALETALFATQKAFDDYAIELSATPEGRAVLRSWMVVSILYSVADMSGGLDDLRKAVKNLKTKVSKLPNSPKKSTLDSKIEDLENSLNASSTSTSNSIAALNKLPNNVSSTLDNNSFNRISENLNNQGLIRFDNNEFSFQSPKTFLNEKGSSFYDFILEGKYYVKYDLSDGRIFLSSSQDGTFFAYAQTMTPLVITSTQNVNDVIRSHLIQQIDMLKNVAGLSTNRSVNVLDQIVTLSNSKTNTFIGRQEDIKALKQQLGDFKNIDLGENIGGINILNRPDVMWSSAGYNGWIINHNMPWAKRVVSRADNVYLATSPEDLNKLMWTIHDSKPVPTIAAYELRELTKGNLKPLNVSNEQWDAINEVIKQMESNGLFISY